MSGDPKTFSPLPERPAASEVAFFAWGKNEAPKQSTHLLRLRLTSGPNLIAVQHPSDDDAVVCFGPPPPRYDIASLFQTYNTELLIYFFFLTGGAIAFLA